MDKLDNFLVSYKFLFVDPEVACTMSLDLYPEGATKYVILITGIVKPHQYILVSYCTG
jgi:hypothetical protein